MIDPVAPRHTAIEEENVATLIVKGVDGTAVQERPLHPKNAEVGTKKVAFSSTCLLEQVDAASVEVGEKITLMDWGNAKVLDVQRSGQVGCSVCLFLSLPLSGCPSGVLLCVCSCLILVDQMVKQVVVELMLEDTDYKKTKKLMWLAKESSEPSVAIEAVEYMPLITKEYIPKGEDILQSVREKSL